MEISQEAKFYYFLFNMELMSFKDIHILKVVY